MSKKSSMNAVMAELAEELSAKHTGEFKITAKPGADSIEKVEAGKKDIQIIVKMIDNNPALISQAIADGKLDVVGIRENGERFNASIRAQGLYNRRWYPIEQFDVPVDQAERFYDCVKYADRSKRIVKSREVLSEAPVFLDWDEVSVKYKLFGKLVSYDTYVNVSAKDTRLVIETESMVYVYRSHGFLEISKELHAWRNWSGVNVSFVNRYADLPSVAEDGTKFVLRHPAVIGRKIAYHPSDKGSHLVAFNADNDDIVWDPMTPDFGVDTSKWIDNPNPKKIAQKTGVNPSAIRMGYAPGSVSVEIKNHGRIVEAVTFINGKWVPLKDPRPDPTEKILTVALTVAHSMYKHMLDPTAGSDRYNQNVATTETVDGVEVVKSEKKAANSGNNNSVFAHKQALNWQQKIHYELPIKLAKLYRENATPAEIKKVEASIADNLFSRDTAVMHDCMSVINDAMCSILASMRTYREETWLTDKHKSVSYGHNLTVPAEIAFTVGAEMVAAYQHKLDKVIADNGSEAAISAAKKGLDEAKKFAGRLAGIRVKFQTPVNEASYSARKEMESGHIDPRSKTVTMDDTYTNDDGEIIPVSVKYSPVSNLAGDCCHIGISDITAFEESFTFEHRDIDSLLYSEEYEEGKIGKFLNSLRHIVTDTQLNQLIVGEQLGGYGIYKLGEITSSYDKARALGKARQTYNDVANNIARRLLTIDIAGNSDIAGEIKFIEEFVVNGFIHKLITASVFNVLDGDDRDKAIKRYSSLVEKRGYHISGDDRTYHEANRELGSEARNPIKHLHDIGFETIKTRVNVPCATDPTKTRTKVFYDLVTPLDKAKAYIKVRRNVVKSAKHGTSDKKFHAAKRTIVFRKEDDIVRARFVRGLILDIPDHVQWIFYPGSNTPEVSLVCEHKKISESEFMKLREKYVFSASEYYIDGKTFRLQPDPRTIVSLESKELRRKFMAAFSDIIIGITSKSKVISGHGRMTRDEAREAFKKVFYTNEWKKVNIKALAEMYVAKPSYRVKWTSKPTPVAPTTTNLLLDDAHIMTGVINSMMASGADDSRISAVQSIINNAGNGYNVGNKFTLGEFRVLFGSFPRELSRESSGDEKEIRILHTHSVHEQAMPVVDFLVTKGNDTSANASAYLAYMHDEHRVQRMYNEWIDMFNSDVSYVMSHTDIESDVDSYVHSVRSALAESDEHKKARVAYAIAEVKVGRALDTYLGTKGESESFRDIFYSKYKAAVRERDEALKVLSETK